MTDDTPQSVSAESVPITSQVKIKIQYDKCKNLFIAEMFLIDNGTRLFALELPNTSK